MNAFSSTAKRWGVYSLAALLCSLAFSLSTANENVQAASSSQTVDIAVGGSVHRVNSPNDFSAPGVKWFDPNTSNIQITNPQYYVVSGKHQDDDTWEYYYSLTAPPGQTVVGMEIASNDNNHTTLLMVGLPTIASLDTISKVGTQSGYAQATSTTASIETSAVIHSTTAQSTSGYYKTWYEDPVGITMNSVQDNISFSFDTNTFKITRFSGNDHRTWYTPTGWKEMNESISSHYGSGNYSAYVQTYDWFANDRFCAGGRVSTYYNLNTVEGDGDGTVTGSVNTYKTGAVCKSLLRVFSVSGGGL